MRQADFLKLFRKVRDQRRDITKFNKDKLCELIIQYQEALDSAEVCISSQADSILNFSTELLAKYSTSAHGANNNAQNSPILYSNVAKKNSPIHSFEAH